MYGGFRLIPTGSCATCHAAATPVLVGANVDHNVGICEPCARLADWRFRSVHDAELAGVPFPTGPGAALVLVVRDRFVDGHPDTLCPRDVLMVERRDEPGKWGLPGGKLEPSEVSVAAAIREMAEETSLRVWYHGLDLLYSGFSARGRFVDTFLCRAYGGNISAPEHEGAVDWKPWPPSEHTGHLRGYYRGLEEAFGMRLKLHKALGNEPPLSQRLGKSALEYVEEMLKGDNAEDSLRHMEALTYVMSEEEKLAAKIVLRGVQAPKLPEPKDRPVEPDPAPEDSDAVPVFDDDERAGP